MKNEQIIASSKNILQSYGVIYLEKIVAISIRESSVEHGEGTMSRIPRDIVRFVLKIIRHLQEDGMIDKFFSFGKMEGIIQELSSVQRMNFFRHIFVLQVIND